MEGAQRRRPRATMLALGAALAMQLSVNVGPATGPAGRNGHSPQPWVVAWGPATAQAATSSAPGTVHVVRSGETLWEIARRYGVEMTALARVNSLSLKSTLQVGQRLVITPAGAVTTPAPSGPPGLTHRVQEGESLWDIARKYGVEVEDLVRANRLKDPDQLQVRQELLIPRTGTPGRSSTPVVSGGRVQRVFAWPAKGPLTSRYGRRWGRAHEGIDIGLRVGSPVRAAASGTVTFAGWGGAYGYLVVIDHGGGVETRYAHNSRLLVRVGERVSQGDVIASSGNTGRATGAHLHFEVRQHGRALDPLRYLR